MKKIVFALLLLPILAIAQKVDVIALENLIDFEKAAPTSKKIKFKGIKIPDGTIYRIGDIITLSEPKGENTVQYRGKTEPVYSSLVYDVLFAKFLPSNNDFEDYLHAKYKGRKAEIIKFNYKKRPDGIFDVYVIFKYVDYKFGGFSKISGYIECLTNGEIVKG